jgi:type I restriction enzyme M protein
MAPRNTPCEAPLTMHWIAPAEKDTASTTLEQRLWEAANQLCANAGLKTQEYPGPLLRGRK